MVRTIPVPGRPHNLTVEGPTVATALQGAGSVALISGREVTEVELGGSPHDVKAVGARVVVANEGAARIDVLSARGDRLGPSSWRDRTTSPSCPTGAPRG